MPSDPSQRDERKSVPVAPDDAPLDETRATDETGGDEGKPSVATAHEWIGKRLGKYQVIDVIGAGGMGYVLKAHDPTIERDVAIKMLHSGTSPIALDRFRAEAKAAGKLSSGLCGALVSRFGPSHIPPAEPPRTGKHFFTIFTLAGETGGFRE